MTFLLIKYCVHKWIFFRFTTYVQLYHNCAQNLTLSHIHHIPSHRLSWLWFLSRSMSRHLVNRHGNIPHRFPWRQGSSLTTIPRDLLDKSRSSYARYLWHWNVPNHVMFRSNQVAAIDFGGTWLFKYTLEFTLLLWHIPRSKYKDVC